MIPFATLVRAELRKTVDVRAARWLLLAAALLAAAAEAIPLVFPHNVTQDRASYLTWAALGLSRLLPLVLLMAMTSEWSQRTAMTTFTLEPRRSRVLAAKTAAAAIVSYFVLAGLFSLLMIPALENVGNWINTGQTFGWLLDGSWSGQAAQIAVSALVWIALPLAVGTLRTVRREVR
jgi:Flp pilus assembly pilin Flp